MVFESTVCANKSHHYLCRPQRIFKDPFRPRSDGVDNILVMCDTYTPAGEPLPTNNRAIGKSLLLFRL